MLFYGNGIRTRFCANQNRESIMKIRMCIALVVVAVMVSSSAEGASWAGAVVSYDAGSTPALRWPDNVPLTDPQSALGAPDDVTGETNADWPNVVNPFSPPYEIDEICSIGEGGHLALRLQHYAVVGSGLEIGVHGVAGLADASFSDSTKSPGTNYDPAITLSSKSAGVEVSEDGMTWVDLGMVTFDMPTNYYTNVAGPFDPAAPADPVVAAFGEPFDPAGGHSIFDGLDFADTIAAFDGTAGGTWLDLSTTGLTQVGYIRFSLADDGDELTSLNMAVDAVVINNGLVGDPIPEPATLTLLAIGALATMRRRRR